MPWFWHRFPNLRRRHRTSSTNLSGSIAKEFEDLPFEIEIAVVMKRKNLDPIPQSTDKIYVDNASYDATATKNIVRRSWVTSHLLDTSSIEGNDAMVVLQWNFPGVSIAYHTAHLVLDDDGPPVIFCPNRFHDIPTTDLSQFQQGLQRYHQQEKVKRTKVSKHDRTPSWVVKPSRVFTWPPLQSRKHRGESMSSASHYEAAASQPIPECTRVKKCAENGETWENVSSTIVCPGVQSQCNDCGQGDSTGVAESEQGLNLMCNADAISGSGSNHPPVEGYRNMVSREMDAPRQEDLERPVPATEEPSSLFIEEPVLMTWGVGACFQRAGHFENATSQDLPLAGFDGSCSTLNEVSKTPGFCRPVVSPYATSDAKTILPARSDTVPYDRGLQSPSPDFVSAARTVTETTESSCHSPSAESASDFQSWRDSVNTGASSISYSQVARNTQLPPNAFSHGIEDCQRRSNQWGSHQLPGNNMTPLYENTEPGDEETTNPDTFWTYDEETKNYFHIDVEQDGTEKKIWYPEEFL